MKNGILSLILLVLIISLAKAAPKKHKSVKDASAAPAATQEQWPQPGSISNYSVPEAFTEQNGGNATNHNEAAQGDDEGSSGPKQGKTHRGKRH